ncbi:MAG: NAD(P)/FAD-dependent oxidoreductase [Candidatus Omnitrophica bacterium]|nr:NAD(P)/FAD-dependent oxidoreductase [Candidatus Omnitrophota bacterium]
MKILIVGAGPIGCYLAQLLKINSNLNIKIIEEHHALGKPVHCAGLVSKEVFGHSRINLNHKSILNTIDGAQIFFGKDSFYIKRKSVAFVIDREKFDQHLGEKLSIDFNTRFIGLEKRKKGFLVETDKGGFYTDILIGADGANSTVRKSAEFRENIEYLKGVQFRLRYKMKNNFVQVYLKKPFFAWIIPESTQIVRAGIISYNPYQDLLDFLRENNVKGEILEKFAGTVPLGTCQTQKENIFLIGDAACQVKPLTQGGIYYGMRCAEILADCILKKRLYEYEKRWRERFGEEINVGLKIRKLYLTLNDRDIAKIFRILKKNKIILERFADFENHSRMFSFLAKTLHIKDFLGGIFISIIKSIDRA